MCRKQENIQWYLKWNLISLKDFKLMSGKRHSRFGVITVIIRWFHLGLPIISRDLRTLPQVAYCAVFGAGADSLPPGERNAAGPACRIWQQTYWTAFEVFTHRLINLCWRLFHQAVDLERVLWLECEGHACLRVHPALWLQWQKSSQSRIK